MPEIIRYARLTLLAQGDLALAGYQPVTPADPYLIRGFELLDAYRHHPTLPPGPTATEALHHFRRALPAEEEVQEHWRRFFCALLSCWQSERNKPLEFD